MVGRFTTEAKDSGRTMLVIDAANVVGSRPTGWWKDRAGAARVLVEQVRGAVVSGRIAPPVTVVLEGKAREGSRVGVLGAVEVVHADGRGDEAILDVVTNATHDAVTLVKADRELSRRAASRGAKVVRPGWLLDRLE